MKLFDRSGGYWLFWWSAAYFEVGMYDIFINKFVSVELLQVIWLTVIALPLIIKPLAEWLNMKTLWEIWYV